MEQFYLYPLDMTSFLFVLTREGIYCIYEKSNTLNKAHGECHTTNAQRLSPRARSPKREEVDFM